MKKIFTILFLLGIIGLSGFAQISTNGLVGYWPFKGDANDASGNGHNGTVHGATLTTDRFGNVNSAYEFVAANNTYIELDSYTGQFGTSDFSVSIWFLSHPETQLYLICKRHSENYGNYWELKPGGFGIDQSNISNNNTLLSNTTINNNLWYHYLVTRSGNNLSFYINGNLTNTLTTSIVQNITETFNATIGAHVAPISGIVGDHDGKLDDVRIYNRALTQQEITALFNESLCYQTITVTDTLIINANITSYDPVDFKNTIKIYPNPTIDHITIDFGKNYLTMNSYTLKITNSLSQIVYTTSINSQQTTIDLSSWTGKGIYFVHLIDAENNTIDIKKIVLQ